MHAIRKGPINLFKIWLLGAMAVALTKLCRVSFGQAALALSAFWAVLEIVFISLGLPQFAM